MNEIKKLHSLGQSLWYDNIQRRLLDNGSLAEMIARGDIRGVTSNPSIFHNAISRSHDYDPALKPMAWAGWSAEEIFYQLAVEDIRAAADLFLPLYEQSEAGDGYVSLEVSPYLANDTEGTIDEAKKLWDRVSRPNLMIKIPATKAGLPAIRKTIAASINVNVTLIFSLERYAEVIEAYLSGLEDRLAAGLPIGTIASVASFFVSRLDTKIDQRLQEILRQEKPGAQQASRLLGKAAIANTKLAYRLFKEKFSSPRFDKLQKAGGGFQRPLWASTSTKDPAYRDVMYVEELIAPNSVNTVPPQTLDAFRDHGKAAITIGDDGEAGPVIEELEKLGISMKQVTHELEEEGVKAFSDAFTALLKSIDERRESFQNELGALGAFIPARIAQLELVSTVQRLYQKDATLWSNNPGDREEIQNRLGWLYAPQESQALLPDLIGFFTECKTNGFTNALLLGMGGSSLAPEVMAKIYTSSGTPQDSGLALRVLDSTDPAEVRAAARKAPLGKTIFIVSSKSGTTSEVNALLDFFWNRAQSRLGSKAAQHFVAITEPGTPLEALARQRNFVKVYLADPSVGGRYSALTAFGLLPATLIGLNLIRFLERAQAMAMQCAPNMPYGRNPGLVLGAILGQAVLQGINKLTVLADPELNAFGAWLEQLIAESSGKQGKGIIPVDLEPLAKPSSYSNDRLFIYLSHSKKLQTVATKIRKSGHPVLEFNLRDEYDLSVEFYRWEQATAIACSILGINAFDQPNVQDAKKRTVDQITQFHKTGKLQEGESIWKSRDAEIFGTQFAGIDKTKSLPDLLLSFLQQAQSGDYIAINAFLPRNQRNFSKLQMLRAWLQQKTGITTTLGFGPRYLHSTGQLHKGGPNNGLFILITTERSHDIEIPGQGITFGMLKRAQAVGDLEALLERGRRAIRIHLDKGTLDDLISN